MALGQVEVNNLNLGQGGIPEIERHFLFVGTSTNKDLAGKVTRIDANTDIEESIGSDAFASIIAAAQVNGGQNWTGAVFALGEAQTWQDAVDIANLTDSFEAVVICDPTVDGGEFEAMQAKATELTNKLGRWCFFLAATSGIKAEQTWAEFEAEALTLVKDVAAELVTPVPLLHGNDIGVLAGRLCNRAVTIADTPMRVATGAVLSLGETPTDSAGKALSLSTLGTLSNARYSVCQTYADYEGTYWGDASTLAAKGSDYQFLEYIRPVHKLNRRVRVKAIRRIGDKILNSTPESIAMNEQYFASDLRAMSKGIEIGGIVFPGEVMPPKGEDVKIQWLSKTKVAINLIVTPHNCPKSIVVNIALDLSNQGE